MAKLELKGFVIMEALVAMIIIAFSFGATGMVYVNVMDSKREGQVSRAYRMADDVLSGINKEEKMVDENWSAEGFDVVKKLSKYKEIENLLMVQVIIYEKGGRKVCNKQKLVLENAP